MIVARLFHSKEEGNLYASTENHFRTMRNLSLFICSYDSFLKGTNYRKNLEMFPVEFDGFLMYCRAAKNVRHIFFMCFLAHLGEATPGRKFGEINRERVSSES